MWKLAKMKRSRGTYYVLRRGGRGNRVAISLGYVTQAVAEGAAVRANEDADRTARLWHRYRDEMAAWRDRRSAWEQQVEGMCPEERHLHEDGEPAVDPVRWLLDQGEPEERESIRTMTLRRYAWGSLPLDAESGPDSAFAAHRAGEVAETTWRHERRRLRALMGRVGAWRLRDVERKPRDVQQRWRRYLDARRGEGVSVADMRLDRSLLVAILKTAGWHGAYEDEPDYLRIIEAPRASRADRAPKVVVPRLTPDEVGRLIGCAPGAKYRAAMALGFLLGFRPSECASQRWEDVDWEARVVVPTGGGKTPMSGLAVPMSPSAYDVLHASWVSCGSPRTGPVVPDRRHPDRSVASIRWGWDRAVERYLERYAEEISDPLAERKRLTPYIMRRSYATIAALAGVPVPVLQRAMRHSTSKLTLDVYAQAGIDVTAAGMASFPTVDVG